MRRCLDKDDVPSLHDAVSLWVPDQVMFTLLAIAAHLPFPGHGVKLSGNLDVHQCSGSDDTKVRKIGFLAVKYFG